MKVEETVYLVRQISLFFSNSFPRAVVYHKVEALIKQDIKHLKAKKCSFPKDKLFRDSKILIRTCLELISSRK